tara:strand:+ start:22 stop:216 length:195 start_codon:yes stop_codon:yes gene_type:complete
MSDKLEFILNDLMNNLEINLELDDEKVKELQDHIEGVYQHIQDIIMEEKDRSYEEAKNIFDNGY